MVVVITCRIDSRGKEEKRSGSKEKVQGEKKKNTLRLLLLLGLSSNA